MIFKNKCVVIMALISLFTNTLPAFGQSKSYDTTTIKLFDEIEAIQAMYTSTNHISFDETYYMEDVDSVTVRDTANATFKIDGEKFHLIIDSVESIQNERWFGTVYYTEDMLVVQKPIPLPKQVFGVDVKDSLFQQIVMDGMTFSDSSGYRKINIICNERSPYNSYSIVYNKTNYRVYTINYSLKKNMDKGSPKRVNMRMQFSNYSTGSFDDSVFSTDSYFVVKNSAEIVVGSAISNFQVVNLIQ